VTIVRHDQLGLPVRLGVLGQVEEVMKLYPAGSSAYGPAFAYLAEFRQPVLREAAPLGLHRRRVRPGPQ
jgi:hypothetical protein